MLSTGPLGVYRLLRGAPQDNYADAFRHFLVALDANEPVSPAGERERKHRVTVRLADWRVVRRLLGRRRRSGALAVFECDTDSVLPLGDHAVIVGRVSRFANGPTDLPLIFHSGRFTSIETTSPAT